MFSRFRNALTLARKIVFGVHLFSARRSPNFELSSTLLMSEVNMLTLTRGIS